MSLSATDIRSALWKRPVLLRGLLLFAAFSPAVAHVARVGEVHLIDLTATGHGFAVLAVFVIAYGFVV